MDWTLTNVAPGHEIRRLRGEHFAVGRFRCGAQAPAWAQTNVIGPAPLVVVPHHGVEILRLRPKPFR